MHALKQISIDSVYRDCINRVCKHAKRAPEVSWQTAYILSDSVATPGGTSLRTQGHAACLL